MKQRMFLTILLFALALGTTAWGQGVCDQLVVDNSNILSAQDRTAIESSARGLKNESADVHVWVLQSTATYPNIDQAKDAFKRSCPNWLNSAGGLKNGEVFILYSQLPGHGRAGIFGSDGGLVGNIIHQNSGRILKDFMAGPLRDKQYAAGLTAGLNQLTALVHSAQTPVSGPVTVNNEAPGTDYSHLWYWLLGLLAAVAGVVTFLVIKSRRDEAAQALADARTRAASFRNRATSLVNTIRDLIETQEALSRQLNVAGNRLYQSGLGLYTDLMSNNNTNPDTKGLPLSSYNTMSNQYEEVVRQLNSALSLLRGFDVPAAHSTPPPPPPAHKKHEAQHRHPEEGYYRRTQEPAPAQPASSTTNSSSVIVVNEPVYEEPRIRYRESESPSFTEPQHYQSSRRSDDDNDSRSSRDSGSSISLESPSNSDSGESVSFDSSSSDDSGSGGDL